jgi:hypothetical protein
MPKTLTQYAENLTRDKPQAKEKIGGEGFARLDRCRRPS